VIQERDMQEEYTDLLPRKLFVLNAQNEMWKVSRRGANPENRRGWKEMTPVRRGKKTPVFGLGRWGPQSRFNLRKEVQGPVDGKRKESKWSDPPEKDLHRQP